MIDAPLALAFTAGLVATVNPCGFAMLPAYLAWFVGVDSDGGSAPVSARTARALKVSGLMSLSFLVVFGLAGVVITAGALVLVDVVPWLAIVVGLLLIAAGIAMLRGWKPVVALPQLSGASGRRGSGGVVLFGVSYAITSLSCTLPVFLAVVAGTITSADLATGVAAFVAYGTGMSLVLVAVTLAVAVSRGGLVRRVREASRHVDRAAGVLMVLAGTYIAFYWAFTLAVPPGSQESPWARVANVPVDVLEQASTWSVNRLQSWALPVAVALGGLVLLAGWLALGRTAGPATPSVPRDPPGPAGREDLEGRITRRSPRDSGTGE